MATRRRWTEETIRDSIAPIVAELGRMPTRRELAARDLGAAWSAMQRHGGITAWRHSLTSASAHGEGAVTVTPVVPAAAAVLVAAALTPPAATPPAQLSGAPAHPSRDDIAQRAYFIAQQRGGDPVANWLAAETELLAA